MINIQSTVRTSPGLCKNVSLAVLFGSNGNSYTVSTQSDMCVLYTHSSQYTDASRVREIEKTGTAVNAACQANLPACHSFVSSDLRERGLDEKIEAGSNVQDTYKHKSQHPW
jgi:hypothetical protein